MCECSHSCRHMAKLRFEHLSSPFCVGHNACISKAFIVSSFVDPKWDQSEPQVKRRHAFKNGIYEASACRGSLRMMYWIEFYEGLVILFSSFRNVQSRNFQGTSQCDLSLPLFDWVYITSCTSLLRYRQVEFDYWLVVWLVCNRNFDHNHLNATLSLPELYSNTSQIQLISMVDNRISDVLYSNSYLNAIQLSAPNVQVYNDLLL